MTETQLPVVIAGAGPAGLLLAQALAKANPPIPVRIIERDNALNERAQGYRFHVRDKGVSACRDVLGPDHFALLRNTCANNHKIPPTQRNTETGEQEESIFSKMAKMPGAKGNAAPKPQDKGQDDLMAVDRTLMRTVLFKGLEEHTIFGKQVLSYTDLAETRDDGKQGVLVHLSDDTTIKASLLVAADGSMSKIRAQLTPQVKVLDTELRMILGKTSLSPAFLESFGVKDRNEESMKDLLSSLMFLSDKQPRDVPLFGMLDPMLFGQRQAVEESDPEIGRQIPEDYIYWALSVNKHEPEARDANWYKLGSQGAADMAEQLTSHWEPKLRAIFKHQDREETRPLMSGLMPLPLPDWSAETGPMVTVIGDAAHAMPPTGGVGAQFALADAGNLGAALVKYGVTRKAIGEYFSQMKEYAPVGLKIAVQRGDVLVKMKPQEQLQPL